MADAPSWPNIVFEFAAFTCPIIIWTLLLIFPSVFTNLMKCNRRAGGTLLYKQLQPLTPRRHHPSRKKKKFRRPPSLLHSNTYSIIQNAMHLPGLLLLGLSTRWVVTLNHLSFDLDVQHTSVTSATALNDVSGQLHTKAYTKLIALQRCVLTQTHISWVWMGMHHTAWPIAQTSSTATSRLLREIIKLME